MKKSFKEKELHLKFGFYIIILIGELNGEKNGMLKDSKLLKEFKFILGYYNIYHF